MILLVAFRVLLKAFVDLNDGIRLDSVQILVVVGPLRYVKRYNRAVLQLPTFGNVAGTFLAGKNNLGQRGRKGNFSYLWGRKVRKKERNQSEWPLPTTITGSCLLKAHPQKALIRVSPLQNMDLFPMFTGAILHI
ncbi:hypothetical protein Zmor_011726 [Zophobas morio]|jgi:hypothetical protein|uniref:Uncharacterized protein n=1 Tax=Zophobas morio TaxID=2755281 RepID=A0AA38HP85_9CUCU|nr:hypothetical protein Zmor_011726 [Zophobas morio]